MRNTHSDIATFIPRTRLVCILVILPEKMVGILQDADDIYSAIERQESESITENENILLFYQLGKRRQV